MSPRVNLSPESLPEQTNESADLDSQITGIRQQIAALQRELVQLEQRQHEIRRLQTLQAPAVPSAPPDVQVNAQLKASKGRSIRSLSQKGELLLLGLLVLFAFVIRIYRLGSFPDTVLADEADNAQNAVSILYGHPPENGFFGLDWTSQPAFSVYKETAFIAIFGFNIMAMRLPSAAISALALIPFYMLLRRQLSVVASLLATILLATEVWYLNFSRSGWNCIDVCFYMLMAMLFLMGGLDTIPLANSNGSRRLKWVYFAAAGVFCSLGLYGYPAGRAITLAVAAFFPIAWLFNREYFKTLLLGYIVLFAVELATYAPEGIYVARNWEHFNGRSNVVLILNDPAYQADTLDTMLHQLDWNIRGPWDGRVNNTPQYSPVGEPQLDNLTGILVIIGMVLTIFIGRFRRQSETWLWWLMLLSGWTLTQLLTVNTPNGARGIGYMPTLIYFAGVSLHGLMEGVNHFFSKKITSAGWAYVAKYLTMAIFTGVILFAGYSNIIHYINWQNKPHTREERYLYITAKEFPQWSTAIVELIKDQGHTMNVGQWREAHPIEDRANPYGISP